MGQKVNPIGLRLGINKTWDSLWYEKENYTKYLQQDLIIKDIIKNSYPRGTIVRIHIKRIMDRINVTIETVRPGTIIGQKGNKIEQLKQKLKSLLKNENINIAIKERRNPETIAQIIADNIAEQIEDRMPYRRAMKTAIRAARRVNVQGIKVSVSGRLNGVDMARTEFYIDGRVPLQTLRANIDYAVSEAFTTYGVIGVKVWVYYGDIIEPKKNFNPLEVAET
ncbi:MAG: 30S ribosomal protein S3 [Leptospiraceae bacterium]|nr:30S ribosomal protein S3 [Leptospiraceae bacterium]MDW7975177.1 30S ribosomal protein S3 [Leptospiraceae bacterium]